MMFKVIKRTLSTKMKKILKAFFITISVSILLYLLAKKKYKVDEENFLGHFTNSFTLPNDKVHIFYDGWFRNEQTDKFYQGWFSSDDQSHILNSAFYPLQGLYSSNNPELVDLHMTQIRDAGVGVVVVSWWPEKYNNSPPMLLILNCAHKYGLKVTVHILKYPKRTIISMINNFLKILKKYSNHPAFYKLKIPAKSRPLPLIYIYDSLSVNPTQWNRLLDPQSNLTIRETQYDALFIGLIVEETDRYLIANSDFDGFYTMHSLPNFTYAATWYRWPYIEDFARDRQLIFIPTVSPGYDYRILRQDSGEVPPKALRRNGAFYEEAWLRAVISKAKFVSISSFNGWLAGTQIEPAGIRHEVNDNEKKRLIKYDDYNYTSKYYLQLTRKWIVEFTNRSLYRNF